MRPRAAFLLAAVCATNVSAVLDTAKYDRSHELKAEHMKIYWKIEGETLKLALEAEATGWVGFGLGETTGMQGADVVYFEKASNTLTDAYVTATNAKPNPDKSQDWTLVALETNGTKLVVEVSRKLVTADTAQDRGITNDLAPQLPTPVIAAWGNDPSMSYHTAANRVGTFLRFFSAQSSSATDDALAALKAGGFSAHDFLVPSFTVPTQSSTPIAADPSGTAYMEFCLDVGQRTWNSVSTFPRWATRMSPRTSWASRPCLRARRASTFTTLHYTGTAMPARCRRPTAPVLGRGERRRDERDGLALGTRSHRQ